MKYSQAPEYLGSPNMSDEIASKQQRIWDSAQ